MVPLIPDLIANSSLHICLVSCFLYIFLLSQSCVGVLLMGYILCTTSSLTNIHWIRQKLLLKAKHCGQGTTIFT